MNYTKKTYAALRSATYDNTVDVEEYKESDPGPHKGEIVAKGYSCLCEQPIKSGDTWVGTPGQGTGVLYFAHLKDEKGKMPTLTVSVPQSAVESGFWVERVPMMSNISALALGCATSTFSSDKVSAKPRVSKQAVSDSQGLAYDYAHVTREVILWNRMNGIQSSIAKQSAFDGNMKCEGAKGRITEWLAKEEGTNFLLYLSGNGSEKGIQFDDGILSYDDLAQIVGAAKFGVSSEIEEKKEDEASPSNSPMISVVIDAPHSGAAVDAFGPLCGGKVRFELFYSSQKEQLSHEHEDPPSGQFTASIFGEGQRQKWRKHFLFPAESELVQPINLGKDQQSGYLRHDQPMKAAKN